MIRGAHRAIALLLVGTVIFAVLLAGNQLWWPTWLQPVGALLYRWAYLLALPVHAVVGVFSPPADHHWPAANWVVSSYLTPWLGWGAWRLYVRARPKASLYSALWRRARRCFRRRETTPGTPAEADAEPLTRRQLIAGAAWGTVWAAGAGTVAYATAIEPSRLQVRRYEVALRGLPQALAGLRIVHLSDTHYGPFVSRALLGRAIDRANALEPDLVVLTGDYTHRSPRTIRPGIELFSGLRPRLGTLAVLGNHDHWEGAEACRQAFRRVGIPLIDNARCFVTPGRLATQPPSPDVPAMCVAGLGDYWEDVISFSAALGDVPVDMPRLLLSHNPDAAERVPADLRVDLMLCGHTHGGQIHLPLLGAPLVPSRHGPKYAGGMCRGPRCPVLVSRGVGLSILPLRLGVAPEIGLLTLHRAGTPAPVDVG